MSGLFKYTVAGLGTTWVRLPSADEEPEGEAFLGPGQVERQTIRNIAIDNRLFLLLDYYEGGGRGGQATLYKPDIGAR